MAIGSIALLITLAIAALAEAKSRADRTWILLAVALLGAMTIASFWRGVRTDLMLGSPPLLDAAAALCTLYLLVDVMGLPVPIGRRLRLGLHSPEWQFDRRLFAQNQAARGAIKDATRRPGFVADRLTKIAGRIGNLPAPDQDWASVRDGWVQAWTQYAEVLRAPAPALRPPLNEALSLQQDPVLRTGALRVRYRSEATSALQKKPQVLCHYW